MSAKYRLRIDSPISHRSLWVYRSKLIKASNLLVSALSKCSYKLVVAMMTMSLGKL